MEKKQISEGAKRVLSITFVLIFISSFIVIVVGNSVKHVHADINRLNHFLENAEGLQANFEQSLQMYTERTKEITDYLLLLRPENEQQYIRFISDIEELGKMFDGPIALQSTGEEENHLNYNISFESTFAQMESFIEKILDLPYFIRITDISFTSPQLYVNQRGENGGNVNLKIQLYIK